MKALLKTADLHFQTKGEGKAHLTGVGLFLGHGGSQAHADKAHSMFQKHLDTTGNPVESLMRTRSQYEKEHPDHFVTMALKSEHEPKDPAKKKEWQNRVNSPRMHIHGGHPGSADQHDFYQSVATGSRDPSFMKRFTRK